MHRATTRQWWNSNPGQYNSKGHALIFTPVSKSMGYRHFCLLAVWVRNNWNPGAAGHDYEPKESALEHNHFPQMIDCNGDDSSSRRRGSRRLSLEANRMNRAGRATKALSTHSWDLGLGATDTEPRRLHHLPQSSSVWSVAQAIWRIRKSPVVTGSFYLDSSHCCNETPLSTCRIPCISGSAGSWYPSV